MTFHVANVSAIPLPAAFGLYAKSVIVDCIHKLVKQRKRLRAQVISDYDQGEWRDVLIARAWEKAASLEEYVYARSDNRLTATVEGRLVRLPHMEYLRYRAQKLVGLLAEFDLGASKLVEVGCGAGYNLFSASAQGAGRWQELRGLELSSTGISVVEQVARRLNLSHISAGQIDLLDSNSSAYAELKGCVAYSYYCLEQLPEHTEAVLRRIAASGVRRMIHIEPTPELFRCSSLRDLATITYIWRQHYLADLLKTAQRLEKEGIIRVVAMRRLDYAPNLRNLPTLLVWEPCH